MTHHMERVVLPFTAIVGQEKLKRALILNAINPNLYGLLIRGEKGTAKSTAVRALADLLPAIEVVKCSFNCSPTVPSCQCDVCNDKFESGEELPTQKRKMKVVELPLGATEDRVVGSLDIEKALKAGIKALQPGILAEVNQGILYIDEVNLLDDHLVDVLLDSAAMGVNTVEREGVSVSHPSRFILVGTMNPEEGELRPQLLDRFGLQVEVKGLKDAEERIEIIRVVEEFNQDPKGFSQKYKREQEELRQRILEARKLLNKVQISEELLRKIAEICIELNVDGHRADFLIARTAKTIATLNLRQEVVEDDVREAAEFVLPHRMRKKPFEPPQPIQETIEKIMPQKEEHHHQPEQNQGESSSSPQEEINHPGASEKTFDIGEGKAIRIKIKKDKKERVGSGRRAKTLSSHSGKYVKAKLPQGKVSDIALDATIRASVARNGNLKIAEEDLREKVREKKVSSVIVFVVDASGSMGAMRRMEVVKGTILAILKDSYQKRDKVALVAFRGNKAEVLLPPTSSVDRAARYLQELPTGGKTPLPDGLYQGLQILKNEKRKNKNIVPIMVLISDGKGNVPISQGGGSPYKVKEELISVASEIKKEGINLVVIDSNHGLLNLGYNREVAEAGDGIYYALDKLDSQGIVEAVAPLKG